MPDPRRVVWGLSLVVGLVATSAFAGAMVTGPAPPHAPWLGFEISPWISASVPTALADETFDGGVSAGVSATALQTPLVGMGVGVTYTHWPSPAGGALLDALFSGLSGYPVSGTKFTMSEWRAGLHLTVSPLRARPFAPWAQAGVGASRAVRRLEVPVEQLQAAGWQVLEPIVDEITYQPIAETRIGFDIRTRTGTKIGLHASYIWLFLADESEPFTAFTLGGHAVFGRW